MGGWGMGKKMKSKIHLSDDDDYRDVPDVRASEATEINENEFKLIDEPMEKDNEKIKRPDRMGQLQFTSIHANVH